MCSRSVAGGWEGRAMEGDGVRKVMRQLASKDEKFGFHSKCDVRLETVN